tara:strand:- start:2126 stop:2599 length:474 start_codon:yes stop_codon:yes gene_type:complete
MNKLLSFIIFLFLISSCSYSALPIDKMSSELETMTFEVVQKKLIVEDSLPNNVDKLLKKWFDDKVKINGFDGDMTFVVKEYQENISSINKGKRVDISLKFEVYIKKPTLSKRVITKGEIETYGSLEGSFTLNEFDAIIQNTQLDLIVRLSRDLKSKI